MNFLKLYKNKYVSWDSGSLANSPACIHANMFPLISATLAHVAPGKV